VNLKGSKHKRSKEKKKERKKDIILHEENQDKDKRELPSALKQ
jgi:hypothetical protein